MVFGWWLAVCGGVASAAAGLAFCALTTTRAAVEDAERRGVRLRLRGARERVALGAALTAVLLGSCGGMAAAAVGIYWAADTTNVLDGVGFGGARTCDEYETIKDAQTELEHELRHHDQGSIRNMDPDGNRRACDGWHYRASDGSLSKSPPAVVDVESDASGEGCDPNYEGACLDPDSYDYDCEGGSGDGPNYTGAVQVVGDDHYGLDRNGDGFGCE